MLRKVDKFRTQDFKSKIKALRDFLLVPLSAYLLSLPFTNGILWVFAWFAFVPLFFVLKDKSAGKAFFFSYLTGIIFWFCTVYWLNNVTLVGLILLVLYLGLYFGIFGLVISRPHFRLLPAAYYLLFVPSIWVVLEYIRSFLLTGFPWALLGYSQYKNLPAIQISDVTGVWGVSFLVMMFNALIYKCRVESVKCKVKDKRLLCRAYLLPCFLLVISFGYGFYKLNLTNGFRPLSELKISVIQANIPQELKWDPKAKHYIMDKFTRLTEAALKDGPDLVIWPEAASPCYLGEEGWCLNKISDLSYRNHTPLLFGTVSTQGSIYYNSALFLDGASGRHKLYHKIHLVPFGEYVPLREIFTFLDTVVPIGDFSPGKEYVVFDILKPTEKTPDKFSVLICFEDVFPGLARNFVKKGAQFLVNITNDAWFGRTSSPYQHLSASVFRAVENRVSLVRAANTGISAFISPQGRITGILSDDKGRNIFVEGLLTGQLVVSSRGKAFYTRFGDIFIFLLSILIICSIFRLFYIVKNKR